MKRRDFLKGAMRGILMSPLISIIALEEQIEMEEPVELIDRFEYNIVYSNEPFNAMLDAIRQLQQAILEKGSK